MIHIASLSYMTLAFRFASKSIAAGAAISLILVITSCVNGRLQQSIKRDLSDDEKNQLRHCHGVLVTGNQSYQLFKCDYYPGGFLLLGKNPGKKLEFRDPLCPDPIYQPKVTFDKNTKKYSFSFDDQIGQPTVDDPDLTIEVSNYQEEYGTGVFVGPGFSDNQYVSTSVRVTVTHKVLGVLFQGSFKARQTLALSNSPRPTSLDALARHIKISPVGNIFMTALADGN
jgi:hypothetical protein